MIFLFAMGAFTFYVGHFYDNGVADLSVFFGYHPWLYLFLIPALAMRLWAEERRSGTMELLLTLPVPVWATVLGKFLAAWAFAGLALALTFPDLDHGQLSRQSRQWRDPGVLYRQLPDGGRLSCPSALRFRPPPATR